MIRLIYKLITIWLISFFFISSSWAGEMEDMKQEMRELKDTVRELKEIVKQQNKRIEELEGQKVAKPSPVVAPLATPEAQTPGAETPQIANKTKKNQKNLNVEASPPPTNTDETQALLDQVNNAPASPGANSKSIGLWKYPTGGSTAAKILPDISVIGTFAGAYYQQNPPPDVLPNPTGTGFTFQELELALQGNVDPYFRYDAFLSFDQGGVELEEAYFTTQAGLPKGLQFKGGQMYVPIGRQNPKHLHAWTFADNNLVTQYILGPDDLSEPGLEASYLFPTPFFLQLQGTFTNDTDAVSFGGTRKQDFLYTGRLSSSFDITDTLTLLMGGSFAYGYNDTNPGNSTTLYGGDMYWKWKPSANTSLAWQTEFLGRAMQTPSGTYTDGGLYSYLEYQFLKRWKAAFRYDQMGIPQGLQARETRLTPALTFNPTEFSQIRLQYEADKIRGQDWTNAVILQLMFVLGAHGAHLF